MALAFTPCAAVALLLAAAAVAQAAAAPSYPADTAAATALCGRPDFKQQRCGLASPKEEEATTREQCSLCGTLFRPLPPPGPLVASAPSYNQIATGVVSLACQGRVLVRAVFKMVAQQPAPPPYGKDCSGPRVVVVDTDDSTQTSALTRCELELAPQAGGGTEAGRATGTGAKEGTCWVCGLCSQGAGCPATPGKWYVDTLTTTVRGCGFGSEQGGFRMQRVGVNINPGDSIELAKFEVCSDPGCFNAAYESAKAAHAKTCSKGTCPAA